MPVTDWLTSAETWSAAHLQETRLLAALGVVLAGLATLWLLVLLVRLSIRVLRALQDAGTAGALKRDKSPGYRIVLMTPDGRARGATRKWLASALDAHLATFNFGAPYKIVRMNVLKHGQGAGAIARARRRMASADADLLVWAERRGRRAGGLMISSLSRGGGLSAAEARHSVFALPSRKSSLSGLMPKAAAFLLAKQLQPALGNPQSFRPEKIKLLAAELGEILDSDCPLSDALRHEIEGDYCAAAVHVAEEAGDLDGLDRVIALRRVHLAEGAAQTYPERALQARMDIGRALLARAAQRFDKGLIQEAISHLSLVVETLRADPSILRAQGASDAMFKAQGMLENQNRKRFAVNFGT
ncbi:MAG: hypothetical protein KDA53_08880 [Hyphomonas sp.]|nr:hypothetical protein [Hyphomonas sp.]